MSEKMGSILALLEAARHRRSIAAEAFRATLAGLTGVHVQVEPINADAEDDGLLRADIQAHAESVLREAGLRVHTQTGLFADVPGTPVLHVDVMTVRLDGRYAYTIRLELWQGVTLTRAPGRRALALTWSAPQIVGTLAAERLSELHETVRSAVQGFAEECRVATAEQIAEESDMNVRDIMTANPLSIEPEAPVAAAIDVMVERKIRHLPVVDDRGTVIGIITDRDLRSAALAPALEEYLSAAARRRLRGIGVVLENLRVRDAMTLNPVTTTPGVAVTRAAALMLERHVGSLPVIDNGKLVGIVTDRDAVKALARQVPALRRLAAG